MDAHRPHLPPSFSGEVCREQKVIEGTLADIGAKTSRAMTPAITVIGEVVNLREHLNLFRTIAALW